jgi:small subunit ribosomal protein S24e
MDLKITEKKEEPLLSRVKLTGEIIFEAATPSYEEVKKKITSSLNCDEKLIVIKNIYTKFGIKKADLFAYIYNNEEAMKRIEPKQKEKKEAKATEKSVEKPEQEEEKPEKKEEKK